MGQTHPSTGKRRILCGGLCTTGPPQDAGYQLFTLGSFAAALLVWAVVSGVWVARANALLSAAPFFTIATALGMFLACALTDPGTLTRASVATSDAAPDAEASPEWCSLCSSAREPGTHHCAYCDMCTREIDHHCNVVGTCVGARNKVYFQGMLCFALFSVVFETLNVVLVIVFYVDAAPSGLAAAMWALGALEAALAASVLWLLLCVALVGTRGSSLSARAARWTSSLFASRNGLSVLSTDLPREPLFCCGCGGGGGGLSVPERHRPARVG